MSEDWYESAGENLRAELAKAYADDAVRLVLADMLRTYHDRAMADEEERVATIDHPWRAYYVEGQRSVVLAFKELHDRARRGEI